MNALVIIANDSVRAFVKFYLEAHYYITVQTASNQAQAIPLLSNLDHFQFIVSEYSEVTKKIAVFCAMKKKDIPIFCISSSEIRDQVLDAQKHLIHWVNPAFFMEKIQNELETRFKELGDITSEPRYVPISFDLLLLSSPIPGGVYIQLSDLKHVRLLKVGSELSQSDLDSFRKKNIQTLFIRQENINVFALKIQISLTNLYYKSPSAPMSLNPTSPLPSSIKIESPASNASPRAEKSVEKTEQQQAKKVEKDLIRGFEMALKVSEKLGFRPEVQALTKNNVNAAISMIRNIPNLSQFLGQLTQDEEKYIPSHSMLLSYLACALGSQLEWKSDLTFQKFTLAAFLHDTPIKNQELASLQTIVELKEKEKEFNAQELKDFKEHPLIAADIARNFKDIPPDVDVIISQHHETPDGKGFPRGLTASRIAPLSTVFIVAHDWVTYLYRTNAIGSSGKSSDLREYIKSRQEIFSYGNFKKTLAAAMLIIK